MRTDSDEEAKIRLLVQTRSPGCTFPKSIPRCATRRRSAPGGLEDFAAAGDLRGRALLVGHGGTARPGHSGLISKKCRLRAPAGLKGAPPPRSSESYEEFVSLAGLALARLGDGASTHPLGDWLDAVRAWANVEQQERRRGLIWDGIQATTELPGPSGEAVRQETQGQAFKDVCWVSSQFCLHWAKRTSTPATDPGAYGSEDAPQSVHPGGPGCRVLAQAGPAAGQHPFC